MATPAHRLIQDQNLNLLYNGATPVGKPTVGKTGRRGGLTGRKALNDISNSRKPSEIPSRKKENSSNIISIEKDPSDAKARLTKVVNEKGKVAGRKALTDLTNSVKPLAQQASRAGQKLNAVAEEKAPSSLVEERFLHNHQECIKARMKSVDMDYFLKSVGLNNDMPVVLSANGDFSHQQRRRCQGGIDNVQTEDIDGLTSSQVHARFSAPNYIFLACKVGAEFVGTFILIIAAAAGPIVNRKYDGAETLWGTQHARGWRRQ
ncbi:UNVERIFIED_CONTAM: putative aquaporin NIP5-1 [Sesamum radiatum]|uniref:Aquaporin NIP5-1 n=1 Tax=Sesamum radiatum TaxID=300843 RepID=A0AAW2JZ69_SESRA